MFNKVAHLHYATHNSLVYTSDTTGRIYCVKYNDRYLQWENFDNNEMPLVQEYMIEALPTGVWGFSEDSQ